MSFEADRTRDGTASDGSAFVVYTDSLSAVLAGLSSADEQITLISRGGKKIRVSSKLCKESSEFFRARLETRMKESGSRKIEFQDVSAEVVQALVAAMLIKKENKTSIRQIKLFQELSAEDLFGLVEFSSSLLMPWIGIYCAQAAAKNSSDIKVLMGLASRRAIFDGTDEESEWREAMGFVARSIAKSLGEAATWPCFADVCADFIDEIMEHASEGAWSEEIELFVPCEAPSRTFWKSQTNSQGVYLEGAVKEEKAFSLLISMDENSTRHFLRLGRTKTALVNDCITARSGPSHLTHVIDERPSFDTAISCYGTDWPDFFYGENYDTFIHDRPRGLRVTYRSQFSKLQRQCIALVHFYAESVGTSADKACVEDAWRHYRDIGRLNLSEILREYICRCFNDIVHKHPRGFLQSLNCSELESIISHDRLQTYDVRT
jgi:hypothetical protein